MLSIRSIPTIRIIYENSSEDREIHDAELMIKRDTITFYNTESNKLENYQRMNNYDEGKTILYIRFPTKKFLEVDHDYNQILQGYGALYRVPVFKKNGFSIDHFSYKRWYPEQVWLYHPLNNYRSH